MKKGFTLLELLVVVLIIGILSAVALPMYEKAVFKTNVMSMMPTARAIKNAQETYYLANGVYAGIFADLDVSFANSCQVVSIYNNEVACGDKWLFNTDRVGREGFLEYFYCPGKATGGCLPCRAASDIIINFYYTHHASKADQIECVPQTPKGEKLCKLINLSAE
jgi:prepilin-type N-terminal cleavage/methylation domain-containing protein